MEWSEGSVGNSKILNLVEYDGYTVLDFTLCLLIMYFITLIFVAAQASIKVISPRDLSEEYFKGIDSSLGDFGNPPYNTFIIGYVWYSPQENGCSPIKLNGNYEDYENLIIMVDRGDCAFAIKVKNAQDVGAKAVVVANNDSRQNVKNIIMSDNGMGGNLFIPAMLINFNDANNLKKFLPNPGVTLSLGFEIPENPEQIRLTLILSSAQNDSQVFMETFNSIGKYLNQKNTYLDTHYNVIQCLSCAITGFKTEQIDCLGGGRYCAPDPDGTFGPLTGKEVIEENLRQICVLEVVKSEKSEYKAYFEYLKEFGKNCKKDKFSLKCSERAMKAANIDVQTVKNCYSSSFIDIGKGEALSKNKKLDKEIDYWRSYGHSYYPAVIINGQVFRGDLEVSALKTGICAGYFKGTEPGYCKKNIENEDEDEVEGFSASTVIIALILFFGILVLLLLSYRHYAKKELQRDMKVQVNSAVNQYFALSDSSTFKRSSMDSY